MQINFTVLRIKYTSDSKSLLKVNLRTYKILMHYLKLDGLTPYVDISMSIYKGFAELSALTKSLPTM